MAFDFPSAPTLGQVYQGYTWDGEKWLSGLAGMTQADADARFVNVTGDTMTGPLTVNETSTFVKTISPQAGQIVVSGNTVKFSWSGAAGGALQFNLDGGAYRNIYDSVNSASAGAGSGAYQKLLSNQILQYGSFGGSAGDVVAINFPVAFPNACQTIVITPIVAGIPATSSVIMHVHSYNTATFWTVPRYCNSGGVVGIASQGWFWYAVGY